MKCIVLLFALCALLLVAAEARTIQTHQVRLPAQIKPVAMQRRFWVPLKKSSHKKASRRSSEEGLIEDQPAAIDDAAAPAEVVAAEVEPEFAAAEELVDDVPTAEAETPVASPAADAAAHEADADAPAVPAHLPHTYFPMHFAHSAGGSVAVANSFSTGKGHAYSHAVAYGAPKHNHHA